MLFIAISIAFLFVIGSVMWLRPSPREKRLAGLRQVAMQNSLRVEWLSSKDSEWLQQPNKAWIRYASLRPQPKDTLLLIRWVRDENGWKSNSNSHRLDNDFGLPITVPAIELTAHDCAIIWAEEGNEGDVRIIAEALKKIAAMKN